MMGEIPSIFESTYPVSRRNHTCYECRRQINVGRKYQLNKGCWVGKWSKFIICQPCADLRIDLKDPEGWNDNEYAPFGDLEMWADEAGEKFPPEELP